VNKAQTAKKQKKATKSYYKKKNLDKKIKDKKK